MDDTVDDAQRTVKKPNEEKASRARRLVVTGAVVSLLGIVMSDMVARTVGGVVLVVGWAFFILGLHAFGRADD